MKIFKLTAGFWDLVYPPRCAVCEVILSSGLNNTICPSCISELEWLSTPLCRICGRDFEKKGGGDSVCGECLRRPPTYSLARSVLRYSPQLQILIHKLKFKKDLSVVPGISELISLFDMTRYGTVDYILPVPLHITRLRERGWNQAIILAKLFFPVNNGRLKIDWLIRKENTVEQTSLGGTKRRANLKTAFAVVPKAQLTGAVVCLIDDVFTTGTTVEECSKVLAAAGTKEILILTLARADLSRGKKMSGWTGEK